MNFDFSLGANYQLNRILPLEQPDTSAVAASYGGPGFEAQAGLTLLRTPHFRLSSGAQFNYSALSTPSSHPAASQATQISLGAFVRATAFIHRHFGLGLEGSAAYQCIDSNNLDVGLPFTATSSCFSDGGLALGGRAFVSAWNDIIHLGIGLNHMPNGFTLPNEASSTPLRVLPSLGVSTFLTISITDIIRLF